MTVSHSAALRNSIANDVLAAIDADVGAGNLVLRTAADAAVATLPLSDTAGTVAGAVLTFGAISDDTNAAGGTVAKATIETNGGTIVLTAGSVTTVGGGGDLEMSSLTVVAGDTVSCSSLSYTAPV